MTTAEPTEAKHEWKTCKTHDVKWDAADEQGKLEELNHNEEYGCDVVDGEKTSEDEANQDTAAEVAPDVKPSNKTSTSRS